MKEELDKLYSIRFDSKAQLEAKRRVWKVLCQYLQRFVPESGSVVDIGCGYCEFVNNIKAAKKYAIDLNPDSKRFAARDVTLFSDSIFNIPAHLPPASADAVFISNLLEHLDSRECVVDLFKAISKIIKPDGQVVVLQPNIKHVGADYWDFLDHKIPLTEVSLVEAAGLGGFAPDFVLERFLPYTTKSAYPKHPLFVWLYLKALPFSGYLFGSQSLLVFKRVVSGGA